MDKDLLTLWAPAPVGSTLPSPPTAAAYIHLNPLILVKIYTRGSDTPVASTVPGQLKLQALIEAPELFQRLRLLREAPELFQRL
ncbi:unnamed protein product [Malus baccata var. baccata]